MATYEQIQTYIREKNGCVVKTCHIAHVKEMHGLIRRQAPNRKYPDKRVHPCPEEKIIIIENALKHFKML